MVLSGKVVTTPNSDENIFIETENLLNVQVSALPNSSRIKSGSGSHLQPKNKKQPTLSVGSQLKPNRILQKPAARVTAMQNSSNNHSSPSSNSEESIASRGLKMKIKRKSGAHKSEDKHEIVNSCDVGELRDKKLKGKRERIRAKSGTSSSECDPYEFGAKTDDDELPVKRMKLEPIVESHATKEVGVNAVTLGTMTEPDMLGPCEPGSTICLNGIVWLETDTGLLVINVTWRGRTYVGTLLDATKHVFAPPCPRDYVSPIESRNPPRGRGKRRGGNLSQTYRNTRGAGKSRGGGGGGSCRSMTSASNSQPNTPTDSDEDIKRSRSRRTSPTELTSEASDVTYPIPCPQTNCCKRFADVTALRFHQNQVHSKKHIRSISTSLAYQKASVVRSLSAEGGAIRRRSPIKKREHPVHKAEKLPSNHYNEALSPIVCNNNVDHSKHSKTSSPLPEPSTSPLEESTVFKTPCSTSPVSTPSSTKQSLSPVSAVSLQNSCVPLPPGVNSTSTDASTFSLLSSPSMPNSIAKPSNIPTSSISNGVRTVTAHTVAIPVDKTPILPNTSPVKKKLNEDHKKTTSVTKRNNVIVNPATLSSPVSSSAPIPTHHVSIQRPIAPSTSSPVLGFPPSALSPTSVLAAQSGSAQVIPLSATVASKPVSITNNNCTNLKPIQPKPMGSGALPVLNNNSLNTAPTTTHSVSGILNDVVSNSTSFTAIEKKPKKLRKRDSNEMRRSNSSGDSLSSVDKAAKKKSESKMNGLSSSNKSCENPVSPAYSDISDANDSPAPVLEKEVDVKNHVDRPVEDGISIGNVGSTFSAPTFFSQPPSLVPAISRLDKSPVIATDSTQKETSPVLDQLSKEKQEETRQIIKENHELKANVSVSSCERRSLPSEGGIQTKKEPPALTKVKDDFKSPCNSIPLSNTPPATKSKDTVVSKSSDVKPQTNNCRPRSTEPLRPNPPSASPNAHFSVPRSSEMFTIPTPTSNAFGSINYQNILPSHNSSPAHQLQCHPFMSPFTSPANSMHSFNPFSSNFDFQGIPHCPIPPLLPPSSSSSSQHKIHELAEQGKEAQPPTTLSHMQPPLQPSPIPVSARLSPPINPVSASMAADRGRKSPADIVAALNLRHSASHPHLSHPGHLFAAQPPFGPPHGQHMPPPHPLSLQEHFYQPNFMMPPGSSLFPHK